MKNASHLELAYFILFGGWVIYFCIHSFLASNLVKQWLNYNLKINSKYYRIFYNVVSTAGLFFLLLFNGSIKSPDILTKSSLTNYISLMLAALGTIIISRSFKSYSGKEFIGLKEEKFGGLKTEGILSYVRHPIYSGTILIIAGYWFFDPTIASTITTITIFIYLPIGMWLEEKKLIKIFGEDYIRYRTKVPAIFPKIKSKLF